MLPGVAKSSCKPIKSGTVFRQLETTSVYTRTPHQSSKCEYSAHTRKFRSPKTSYPDPNELGRSHMEPFENLCVHALIHAHTTHYTLHTTHSPLFPQRTLLITQDISHSTPRVRLLITQTCVCFSKHNGFLVRWNISIFSGFAFGHPNCPPVLCF